MLEELIEFAILFTGYAPEAFGGPCAFHSNCFCGICNGKSRLYHMQCLLSATLS